MSPSLQQLIDTTEAPLATSSEAAADLLYFQGEYRAAATAYLALEDKSAHIQEKLGASLQQDGDNLAARNVFRPIEGELSPIGKVIFAQALFASVSRWSKREGYEAETQEGVRILSSVLDLEVPPHFAFVVASANLYCWKLGANQSRVGGQIIRGANLYPRSEQLLLNADQVRCFSQVDPAESIKHLLKFSIDVGVTPRLLWTIYSRYRQLGQSEDSLRWLTEAIDSQRRQYGSNETVGILLAQRAEMQIQAGSYASAIADALEAYDLCTNQDERMASALIGCLASLKADNRVAADRAAAAFLETLLAKNQLSWFIAAELYGRIDDEHWSGFEIVSLDIKMTAFADLLDRLPNAVHQAWFRYLVASEIIDSATAEDGAEPDWGALAQILGDAAKLTQHHPHVEALDVRVQGELPTTNWGDLGYRWMLARIALKAAVDDDTDLTDLPSNLYADSHKRDQFFTGIVKALKASSPSPHAFDVLEGSGIREYLVEKKMARVLYDMLIGICAGDNRTDPLLFLGWSAQSVNLRLEAFRAYFALLDQEPGADVAITNALLMCDGEPMASYLEELKHRVTAFKSSVDAKDQHKKVDEAFESARQRCLSKRLRLAEILAKAMEGYAPFGDRSATLEDLSLLDATTLVALLRTSPPAGDQLFIPRVSTGNIPFSRLSEHRRGFFTLMQLGLISPGNETDPTTVRRTESGSYSWVFPQIDWHVSPHAMSLVDKVRAIPHGGKWPKHWAGAARPLAIDFAREEIAAYLDEQALDRNWPEPDRDDRLQQLLAMLVERVSVAEAYYLIYLGAMSAADNRAKHPINATQASNLMVKRTGERLDRVVSGGLTPKSFNRSWNSPRTQMHMALWEDVLGMGDVGFTDRLAQIKFPGERTNRRKSS